MCICASLYLHMHKQSEFMDVCPFSLFFFKITLNSNWGHSLVNQNIVFLVMFSYVLYILIPLTVNDDNNKNNQPTKGTNKNIAMLALDVHSPDLNFPPLWKPIFPRPKGNTNNFPSISLRLQTFHNVAGKKMTCLKAYL